ncbi:Wzz/FepE/Etk N-terminal domain-containing protein [Luteolibacter arcticus]|uniref:Wzz/FepE/Etk N-terminal domain-containing protein n=1 Tax=Luteolibacter arcticus TaxID=1581411 RepID=A0ABT3GH25_9BACT|nr:Wzz/FepE/Etk N-terminal domain-containing protein [Luteolibacter arcticus]MCW1922890.1 Wzz/FepE/Etk N-terminal domain-containing protein [Luteolibacter arcticus]
MQKTVPTPSKGGLGLQDILFVLFKHKWKILFLGLLGLGAAAGVYTTQKPLYESHSRILVKHVIQRGGTDGIDSQVDAGGRSGEQVINTEMVILRSGDLAAEVAQSVGVERLVPNSLGQSALTDAANVVQGGLEIAPESRGSNVLLLTYRHPDPELARDVLESVIKRYPERHLEIHRSVGAFDSVSKQANVVREKLHKTEQELNKLKADSGIISVHEQSLSLSTQRDKTQGDIVGAEAELAAQSSKVDSLEKKLSGQGATTEAPQGASPRPAAAAPKPEQVEEYRELAKRLEYLQTQDLALRSKFASGNPQVVRNQQDINSTKAARNALLAKAPGLVAESVTPAGEPTVNPLAELDHEKAVMGSIIARIGRYKSHLAELEDKFKKLTEVGPQIAELERQREMQDGEYRLLESNLKKAEVDRNLDRTEIPGLKIVESPTLPKQSFSETTKKLVLGLAGAGFALGLGIAFLLELVVDRRITRPTEIEGRLQVPLMLSIPYVRPKNRGAHLIANDHDEASGTEGEKLLPAVRTANGFPAFAGRTDHFIHPYSEAIRDRIVFNFQINNMTHKPKLMAVTGLSAGAGTSTIAAGLAKAFSEVNGAKVLLVDLNSDYPDDNPMFGNKPLHSVVGALQAARNTRFKEGGQNLYLASAAATKADPSATPFGPMHLYELLPHFRASEFDYVIFDMPPMGQTSPTLAMAGLMDKVLLVVDGEDTNRDTLKWGYSELVKGRADVSCVFNKARSHAPRWVAGDI